MAKRKIVTTDFDAATGTGTLRIWSAPSASGAQEVEHTVTVDPSKFHVKHSAQLAFNGFVASFGNQYNRLDDPTHEAVHDIYTKLHASVLDGTWEPGRRFAEAEPSDLELAIAEATAQPIHLIQKRIEEEVWRVGPTDPAHPFGTGEPKRDARGRVARVFTRRYLDNLANDPRVRPILARLTAERAKRLAAKRPEEQQSVIGDLFGTPAPQPVAAE